MKARRRGHVMLLTAVSCALTMLGVMCARAQIDENERAFPQSKAEIENTLKKMQPSLSGRLPVLEGFADTEQPLDHYDRGYYQASVQISSAVTGGSVVRIGVKITAWYSDPVGTRSGYQLLTSNGRLETDLLDRLGEQLAKVSAAGNPNEKKTETSVSQLAARPTSEKTAASVPEPSNQNSSSPFARSLKVQEHAIPRASAESIGNKADTQVQSEIDSLEEILKNQAHPKNLVAVKKSGTPVVATPSLNAKPLFLASMHDEFEMLDFNQDWVHVRVSGLSRGWIWRNSLEMPEGIPDTAASSGPSPSPAADLFHVTREETGTFPGDWQPLRGKNVKIISVQKVDEERADNSSQDKLEYAKLLLDKNYSEMRGKPQQLEGIVLIFDSADGGMIAATLATLQQWKAGALSDAALWHNCFFDPPEILNSAGSSGTQ